MCGVILAQPVWQGDRPIVLVVTVLLSPDAPPETASGLLHACVKSAYDAAVYEVHFPLTPALEAAAHSEEAHILGRYAVRYLGSRHDQAPGERLSPHPTPPGTTEPQGSQARRAAPPDHAGRKQMTQATNPKTRVLIGVRGMDKEAGERISAALLALQGVSQAQPDQGQIAVQYDPSALTVMDLLRAIRKQGFLAGML